MFGDYLSQSLAEAKRAGQAVAVMFLDLDRFKDVNDTLGHNTGDLLLQAVAGRLARVLRQPDRLARMGGDEFTILLSDVKTAQDAVSVAERILGVLAPPFSLNGKELFITASIGISLFPSDGCDVETLVKNADTAMYRAKDRGGNTYQLYTEDLNAAALERMTLENSLRSALDREEFLLYYQPLVDIRTGEILGAEALLRWHNPEVGLVFPDQFVPLTEETGLIVPITHWVLKTACAQYMAWQQAGVAPGGVAVNISARHFHQEDLLEAVRTVLEDTGLDPGFLILELTESTLMRNPELAASVLGRLKAMGVGISIDDFGTGHSSLSRLKCFPANSVKIDRSFVRGLAFDRGDEAIAGAIVALAHSLKLRVIAEGVETLEQLEILRSLGCDEVQGYFIAEPAPADEFTRLLERDRCTMQPV